MLKRETTRCKEVTYFVETPLRDFSLCLGCFSLAMRYLYVKAQEHCREYPDLQVCKDLDIALKNLKLRLNYDHKRITFAKVDVAKITGKRPQIMIKLCLLIPKRVFAE